VDGFAERHVAIELIRRCSACYFVGIERVLVRDHDRGAFLQSSRAAVGVKVDVCKQRAIAEVEIRDRVVGASASFDVYKVVHAESGEGATLLPRKGSNLSDVLCIGVDSDSVYHPNELL